MKRKINHKITCLRIEFACVSFEHTTARHGVGRLQSVVSWYYIVEKCTATFFEVALPVWDLGEKAWIYILNGPECSNHINENDGEPEQKT